MDIPKKKPQTKKIQLRKTLKLQRHLQHSTRQDRLLIIKRRAQKIHQSHPRTPKRTRTTTKNRRRKGTK